MKISPKNKLYWIAFLGVATGGALAALALQLYR